MLKSTTENNARGGIMTISLVKGKHAANCPCRICKIAREVIFRVEESRFQEAPEQPNPEAIKRVFAKNGIKPIKGRSV